MKTIIEKMVSNGLLYLIAENKTQKVYKTYGSFLPIAIDNNKEYFIVDNKEYLIDPNKVEFGYKYALSADFQTMWDNLSPLKKFKYNTYKDAKNAYMIRFKKEPDEGEIRKMLDCVVVTE